MDSSKMDCKEYWDERFEEEEHYEWFSQYEPYRHLVKNSLDCIKGQLLVIIYKINSIKIIYK